MNLFKGIVASELLKVKNTFALLLIVMLAASIPIFVSMEYFKHSDKLAILQVNPWVVGWRRTVTGVAIFAGPCIVIMFTALQMNIEHKVNGWRYVFTLPVPPSRIFFSKLFVSLLLLIGFYFFLFIFFIICGLVIGTFMPQSNFFTYTPEYLTMFVIALRTFIALLAIFAIHFWLSFRIKNMFINIAIGLVLVFLALMTYPSLKNFLYFPYNYGELTVFNEVSAKPILARHEIYSCIIAGIVTFLSYLDFTKRFKG